MSTAQSQENRKSGFEPKFLTTQSLLFPLRYGISFSSSSTSHPSTGHTRNEPRKMKDMETMACFKNKCIRDLLGVKQSTQSFGEGKGERTLWQEKELITQHGAGMW